jgi:hypothetical protein
MENELSQDAQMTAPNKGISNEPYCFNKCQFMFNQTQFAISLTMQEPTNEYRACLVGCGYCTHQIDDLVPADPKYCFTTCKNNNWGAASPPIVKGVIEPNLACIMGCIIGECQVLCTGGSLGSPGSKTYPKGSWPKNGCRIVSSLQSQTGAYIPYNGPDAGTSGNDCCSNATSLCHYSGTVGSANYNSVLGVARTACNMKGKDAQAICTMADAQCGNNPPVPSPAGRR